MRFLIIEFFFLRNQRAAKSGIFQPKLPCGLLLLFILFPILAYGSGPSLVLGPDIPYGLVAEGGEFLTFEEAKERLDNVDRSQRDIFAVGYLNDVYWLTFQIPQRAFKEREQWLRLAPTYLDNLRLYYRETGSEQDWTVRELGDLSPWPRGDLDYRFPVLRFSPPENAKGYEFIIRVQSTSATVLYATLWDPGAFVDAATTRDSIWGFYFGLALLSAVLSLYLAVAFGGRLLWSIFSFSISYLLVACIQGYIDWLLPIPGLHLQHFLTSITVLLAYPALLWVAAEGLGLREHVPRVYAWVIKTAAALGLLLVSIPLDFFGQAMTFQAIIYFCTAIAMLIIAIYILWLERFKLSTLLMAASPLLLMTASVIALSSVFGLIKFDADIYLIWQYMLVVNMLLVMGIAISRILQQRREQKEAERLSRELDIEREARFHQRQFMGMVSHEFRTPLSIMLATLQNLRAGGMEQAQQDLRFEKMERAIGRLTQLTDNCLADARLSASSLYVEPAATSVHELIHSAAAIVDLSDRHQLKVTVNEQEGDSEGVHGPLVYVDAALMRIALANVVDNAVKYSEDGVVLVDCSVEQHAMSISVLDQGGGIPARVVPYIFERYRRTEVGEVSGQGVGLGLFVARQIVESHGGRLELAENSNRGCRFLFTLPVSA